MTNDKTVFLIGLAISGILPEVSVDPMKVVQDAVLEFTDKKDLFLAYMSSMLVGGPGEKNSIMKQLILLLIIFSVNKV